LIQPNLLIK